MTQFFYFFATLLGGLAIFIYGMGVMSDSLKGLSQGRLEKTLKQATTNDLKGFVLGSGITALLHSSSTLTVMLVGLVNSGLLPFENTFGVILGSNVGTTLNAWIISLTGLNFTLLDPKFWVPLISFLGVAINFLGKTHNKRSIGLAFMGFSLLMYGMELMSGAVNIVSDLNWFKTFLLTLESPLTALIISSLFTGIIQSSSATIGIVEALTLSNPITCKIAIPLVLGANIGTCVTAFISSFKTNKNAKRVVLVHFGVNILGSVICLGFMYLIISLKFNFLNSSVNMTGISLIHTLFNLGNALMFMPFKSFFIKVCKRLI